MTDRRWLADMLAGMVPERFSGSMVEYFDGTLRLPHSTRYPVYIAEESPWLIEPMRAANDSTVKRVDVRGPAGAAKSLIGEMHIAWCVDNDPGLYYYVHQSDPDGVDAMEDRILPMLQANDFLAKRLPNDRHKQRIAKIAFPHMSLYCVGANMSAAQSKRVKFLTMEEPHMYRPGMMSAFEKRCEGVRNAKILTLSTGSVLGDESDNAFQSGTCEEWQVPCPHCRQFQRMTDGRDRLIYTQGEKTTDENGQYNWKDILPTVRYNCEHCGRDWPSDEASRRAQAQQGRYEATNPNAPEWHRSFHWEAAAVHYFHLGSLLMEKLKASYAAKAGQIEPLRDYIQKRRALAWDESPTDADGDLNFERMKGQYLKGDKFEGEIARFLTIDNQAGRASKGEGAHRWYVCRAYGEKEARIIDEGRLSTWEDVEERRIALGVDPARTLIDCAFATVEVQERCVKYGWQALWGDNTNRRDFPHHEMANGQRITRRYPFSSVNVGHVGIGTDKTRRQARYFFWCQEPIKSLYHRLRGGLSSYRLTVPQNISADYVKHTSSEFKRMEIARDGSKKWRWTVMKGRPNHLLDCDQMSIVAALLDVRIRAVLYVTGGIEEETSPAPESTGAGVS